MNAERPCEICGGQQRHELYVIDGWPIVRCRDCGLVYVGRRVGDQELVLLYDEAYYEDGERPGYQGYEAAEQRKRHHDRTLLDQLERWARPGSVFEIGCAYGYFLDEARQRGWQVAGSEPSRHACEYARSHLGLDVTEVPFSARPTEPETRDAIVMWDVIEHLPDPRATVEQAHAWLRPGGILGISTGNVDSLAARLHGSDWSLMTPPWHQFFFSRRTLRRLLEEVGFEVIQVRGDGNVAVDRSSARPRVPAAAAAAVDRTLVRRLARRLGAGGIMFMFGRKAPA